MKNILVIIPAYNEESTIGKICKKLKDKGFDILVLDDLSNDNTANVAELNGAKVIINQTNIGYQSNLYKGLNIGIQKGYSKAITMDADGQHRIQDVQLIGKQLENYDLVLGTRDRFNRESEKYIGLISQRLYNIKDPLSGLKGYNLKSLKGFNFYGDDTIATSAAIYLIEKGHKFIEVPIKITDRKNGYSSLGEDVIETNYTFILKFLKNLSYS